MSLRNEEAELRRFFRELGENPAKTNLLKLLENEISRLHIESESTYGRDDIEIKGGISQCRKLQRILGKKD